MCTNKFYMNLAFVWVCVDPVSVFNVGGQNN